MNNFTQRTITGIVFVFVIISAVWLSYISMLLLFSLISILGLWEFYSLVEKSGYKPQKLLGILFLILSWLTIIPGLNLSPAFLFLTLPILLIAELYNKHTTPFINVAYTVFGFAYLLIPFYLLAKHAMSFYLPLEDAEVSYYPYLMLGVFFLIWANDTFAYLVGKFFGKTKLFERISPKKTWEGTIGGGVCTVIVAALLAQYFTEFSIINWMCIAIIIVVAGTLGDLVESMFKRSIDVKDSGSLIPGHGGVLDRFDSFLLAAPLVFLYVFYC